MSREIKTMQNEKGITGLETAIILIAFVIVASVLAYVVISAGLFSSQKAKDAVNAGIEQTGATVEIKGNVIVQMESGFATKAFFTVGVVPGGNAVDLTDYYGSTGTPTPTSTATSTSTSTSTATATDTATSTSTAPASFINKLIISFIDAYHVYPSLPWQMEMVNANNGDNMLDPGELAQIIVDLGYVNTHAASNSEKMGPYHSFTLEIKPPDGSVLTIERTLPSRVSSLVNLR
jgi:archaeal flagellin FlaB